MASHTTVVICTHNARPAYFKRCLDALEAQRLPKDQWDLLVVDNRSDQPLAGRLDLSWHRSARVVREETLGLTPARLRGIRESRAELLVFVDDDNVLDADYLEAVQQIAQDKPFIGAWSGQCRPGFERAPPEWTRRYWGNLAIREFDKDLWSNLPLLTDTMPLGAGLCLRRPVAERYLHLHDTHKRSAQLDRTGRSLLSGGDNDMAACACDIGLGVGLFSALKLTHLIPPDRLTEDYLVRLTEGIYFSSVVLAHLRSANQLLASFRVRWRHRVRAALFTGPHRRIQAAALRGREKGLEYVATLGTGAAT
jgi:glycosyltransferase involved in cell wall biosynthesis